MCLHAWVVEVIHERHERRQQLRMVRRLQLRTEVGAHLAERLACRPPHLGVAVLQPRQAHVGQRAQLLLHQLGTALRNLREADERRMAAPPVGVAQPRRKQLPGGRHDRVAAKRHGDAVEAFLAKLEAVACSRLLVLVGVSAMPQRVVLDVHQERHEHLKQAGHKVGQLAHHPGRLLARLTQRDQELGGELAGCVVQLLGARNLEHRLHHVHQLLAQEAWVRLRHLDQNLQPLLRRQLVAAVEAAADAR
mmetsp:Transcript_11530/g.34148  ORF Transcript_11530/g.34148 Transcript_11530/m.34148 type:complete len:249 (-) Transcript_11530:999-1745(-)